jgi:hypothetical protein
VPAVGKTKLPGKASSVDHEHTVSEMANEVLVRQAKARAKQTGETLEEALETVLETEAGSQLRGLQEGPHGDEKADEWQEGVARERAEERTDASD